MSTTPSHSAAPLPWPNCRTRGPITTRRVRILKVARVAHRMVHLEVALEPTEVLAVTVPDMVRGLGLATAACRTGAPVWMTAVVARGRWVPVLFRCERGDQP